MSKRSHRSRLRELWLLRTESEREPGTESTTPDGVEHMGQHLEVTDENFKIFRIEEKKHPAWWRR